MAPTTVLELREQAKRMTPLTLVSNIQKEDLSEVKVEYTRADGSIGKVALPRSDYSSAENLLYCLKEFQEAADEYNWAGQVRFQKYRKTLVGDARETWDAAVAVGPQNHQLATFQLAIREVIRGIAGVGSYDHLIEYMEAAKKPHNMTPSQLAVRLSTLCHSAQYFLQEDGTPGPDITPLKQRRLLLSMHPNPWIEKFTDAGKTAATETTASIVAYMTIQYSKEAMNRPTKKQKTESNVSNSNGRGSSYSRFNSSYGGRSGRGGRGGRGSYRGGRSGRGRGGRGNYGGRNPNTHPDAPCKLHNGEHKWRKCMFNPNADSDAPRLYSYRNQSILPNDRNRDGGHGNPNRGYGGNRTDNYYANNGGGRHHSEAHYGRDERRDEDLHETPSGYDVYYSKFPDSRSPFPPRR